MVAIVVSSAKYMVESGGVRKKELGAGWNLLKGNKRNWSVEYDNVNRTFRSSHRRGENRVAWECQRDINSLRVNTGQRS